MQPIAPPAAPEPAVAPDADRLATLGDGAKAPSLRASRVTPPTRPLEPIDPLVIEPMTMPLMAVSASSGEMPIEIDDLRIEPLQIQ